MTTQLRYITPVEQLSIGSDPEVFLQREDGSIAPVCGLIGGFKEAPLYVDGGALQEDNIMAELNTDPALTSTEFITNINKVLSSLNQMIQPVGLHYEILASATIPAEIPIIYPEATVFGCDPDYNAYTGTRNESPEPTSLLRTCAGHIHLGYKVEGDEVEAGRKMIKYLDWVVGTWSVLVDKDKARREKYGKAGAFRPKPYGVEYRVPSNFWLQTEELQREVFERTKYAYRLAQNGVALPNEELLIAAINGHDVSLCTELQRGIV